MAELTEKETLLEMIEEVLVQIKDLKEFVGIKENVFTPTSKLFSECAVFEYNIHGTSATKCKNCGREKSEHKYILRVDPA
jgi:hypothetical protein